jgi:hypothetical protein
MKLLNEYRFNRSDEFVARLSDIEKDLPHADWRDSAADFVGSQKPRVQAAEMTLPLPPRPAGYCPWAHEDRFDL